MKYTWTHTHTQTHTSTALESRGSHTVTGFVHVCMRSEWKFQRWVSPLLVFQCVCVCKRKSLNSGLWLTGQACSDRSQHCQSHPRLWSARNKKIQVKRPCATHPQTLSLTHTHTDTNTYSVRCLIDYLFMDGGINGLTLVEPSYLSWLLSLVLPLQHKQHSCQRNSPRLVLVAEAAPKKISELWDGVGFPPAGEAEWGAWDEVTAFLWWLIMMRGRKRLSNKRKSESACAVYLNQLFYL